MMSMEKECPPFNAHLPCLDAEKIPNSARHNIDLETIFIPTKNDGPKPRFVMYFETEKQRVMALNFLKKLLVSVKIR